MARVPVAGRVKTRLARQLGVAEAVRFYRSTSRAVLLRLSQQPFWETIIAATPDASRDSRTWPRDVLRIGQGTGDLGQRLHRPMRVLPPGPVCIVGTDIPAIEAAHVRRAFALLRSRDAVFGPAEDGGFWLVGMRRRPRMINPYAGVRWSSASTLQDVLRNFDGGLEVGLGDRLGDVDEPEDLKREAGRFGRVVRGSDLLPKSVAGPR
jgi:rSAM/selenodomain-associated transferase 1